jgi:DNA-binding transcriptional MerR regulator
MEGKPMTYSVNDMCVAGCTSRRGIRFWEQQGMLGEVARSNGGTRQYTADQIQRAKIIAAAQFGGWSLEEAKKMLAEWGPDVRFALVERLAAQAKAALKLAENLPVFDEVQEHDLDTVYDL